MLFLLYNYDSYDCVFNAFGKKSIISSTERKGPNKVGVWGLGQPLADALN
jgi:NADH:ubiquinone oxidoreductase subunit H